MESLDSQRARKSYAPVICLVAMMAFFFSASLCLAQSDLVRLIPPDAPVIAGLHHMPQDQSSSALWLATRNNLDDINRLVALTDSDLDRRFDYVVVADWPSPTDNLGSHVLVAGGRFTMASILSTIAHPKKLTYNGVTVLAVAATGTEETARWLAIPENNIAIFGTPAGVQVAIDRYRSGAGSDPRVLERLRNAHDRNQAWSSVVLAPRTLETASLHATPDNLSPCLNRMREVDLGIQPGKNVTIDLHTESRDGSGGAAMECMSAAIFKSYTPEMRVSLGGERQPSMRLTLTRAEYDRWLDSFRKSKMSQTLEAFISGAEPATADNLQTVR
jgi:hypothetical protein